MELATDLQRIEDIEKVWGNKKHFEIFKNIDPKKCPRCTQGISNEAFENVVIQDKCFSDFI
jgi:hypothetical protein